MADEIIAGQKVQIGLDAAGFKADGVKLQATAKGITQALNNISGAKADQKLQEVQAAVSKLGGVSNLSAPQVARLRGELEKLGAAGAKIPATLKLPELKSGGLGNLQGNLFGQIQSQAQGLATSLGPVGTALTALGPAGVAAAAGFGALSLGIGTTISAAVEAGSKISDLSAKTGLSTDAVQAFGFAAEQTGSSVDDVAKATILLQKEIAGGSDVFKRLGLDLANLRSLNTDQQFLAVAEAIRKVEDPADQARLALQAFGRGGAELLPAIREGFTELAEEARSLGLVLGADAVQAGDKFGDSMDRASRAWTNLKATVGGKLIGTLQLDVALNVLSKQLGGSGGGGFAFEFGKAIGESLNKETKGALEAASKRAGASLGGPASLGLPDADAQLKILSKGLPAAIATSKKELADYNKTQDEAKRKAEEAAKAQEQLAEAIAKAGLSARQKVDKSIAGQFDFAEKTLGKDGIGSGGVLGVVKDAFEPPKRDIIDLTPVTKDWAQELQNVSNLANTLPGVFGKSFGAILGGIAGIGSAIKGLDFSKALNGGGSGFSLTGGGGLTGLLGNLSGIGQLAGAAFGIGKSLVSGLKKLFGGESEASKAAKAGGKILGKSVSEEMAKEVLARAKETGKSVEQVFKDIKIEELTGKLGDLQGKRGSAVAQIQTGLAFFGKVKGAAAAQGRIFGTTFAAVVKAEGFDKALEIFRETFAGLPEDVKAAIPADIQKLFAFGENEQFAAALDAASALAESFKGTVGLIGLSTQTLADFGAVAKATFDEAAAGAVAAGASQEEAQRAALQAVLPLLIQMQTAAKQTGIALDENTQALIDQAKAAGIEIPVDPLLQVVDILKEISLVLKEIGGIEVTPKINVPNVPGAPQGGHGGGPSFASGGIGRFDRRGTMAQLHGLEAIVPLDRLTDAKRVFRQIAGIRPDLFAAGIRAVTAQAPALRIPSFETGGIVNFGGSEPSGGRAGFGEISINAPLNLTVNVEAMGDVEAIGEQVSDAISQEYPRLCHELVRLIESNR